MVTESRQVFDEEVVYLWARVSFTDDEMSMTKIIPTNLGPAGQFIRFWKHNENVFRPQVLTFAILWNRRSCQKRDIQLILANGGDVFAGGAFDEIEMNIAMTLLICVQ